ncbi:hypothetical protein BRC82_09175 [Halobacteriales archaeon QS_1_67_19]|nr:MAG: hypothetical protein BRC82_09175 [Halobacteriales archaeon QS_1_67_19]
MESHIADARAVEPTPDRPRVRRALGDAVGREHALHTLSEADSGEQIPLAYRYHQQRAAYESAASSGLRPGALEGDRVTPADRALVVEPAGPQRTSEFDA